MLNRIAALVAASLLVCAPAAAQLDTRTLPVAAALAGAERMPAVQGTGCPGKTTPCASVVVTPDLVKAFLLPTFQGKDADLDAIAALATTSFGRGLLTQADAAAVRSAIGVSATGADATYAYRASNLSDLANTASARTNLGLGSAATANTGTSGSTVPLLSGANTWAAAQTFSSAIAVTSGGTGATTASTARANLGVPTLATGNNIQVSTGPYLSVLKADGVQEIGKYLDWHEAANTSATDYEYRITLSGNSLLMSGGMNLAGPLDFAFNAGTDIGSTSYRARAIYSSQFRPGTGAPIWTSGSGTPLGNVTAPVGSLYTRTDGGTATTLYVKESGTDASGWVAK